MNFRRHLLGRAKSMKKDIGQQSAHVFWGLLFTFTDTVLTSYYHWLLVNSPDGRQYFQKLVFMIIHKKNNICLPCEMWCYHLVPWWILPEKKIICKLEWLYTLVWTFLKQHEAVCISKLFWHYWTQVLQVIMTNKSDTNWDIGAFLSGKTGILSRIVWVPTEELAGKVM